MNDQTHNHVSLYKEVWDQLLDLQLVVTDQNLTCTHKVVPKRLPTLAAAMLPNLAWQSRFSKSPSPGSPAICLVHPFPKLICHVIINHDIQTGIITNSDLKLAHTIRPLPCSMTSESTLLPPSVRTLQLSPGAPKAQLPPKAFHHLHIQLSCRYCLSWLRPPLTLPYSPTSLLLPQQATLENAPIPT